MTYNLTNTPITAGTGVVKSWDKLFIDAPFTNATGSLGVRFGSTLKTVLLFRTSMRPSTTDVNNLRYADVNVPNQDAGTGEFLETTYNIIQDNNNTMNNQGYGD